MKREDLGFRYTIPFAEGARRMVAWLDSHGQVERSADHPWYDRLVAAWLDAVAAMAVTLQDRD